MAVVAAQVTTPTTEIPSLLDSQYFKFLKSPSIQALWVVFSLIIGTLCGTVTFYALKWTIDILSITAIN